MSRLFVCHCVYAGWRAAGTCACRRCVSLSACKFHAHASPRARQHAALARCSPPRWPAKAANFARQVRASGVPLEAQLSSAQHSKTQFSSVQFSSAQLSSVRFGQKQELSSQSFACFRRKKFSSQRSAQLKSAVSRIRAERVSRAQLCLQLCATFAALLCAARSPPLPELCT